MKNINSESCKYMKVGTSGKLVTFSDAVPDVTRGNVKVRYYLTQDLKSLDEEFMNNVNVISVDLSHMKGNLVESMNNAFNGCISLQEVNLGDIPATVSRENAFANINTQLIVSGKDADLVSDVKFEALNPQDTKVLSIPTANTVIKSVLENGVYNFYAEEDGVTVPVILSMWDNYTEYVTKKNPRKPELIYFLNTEQFTGFGVPEADFISKKNKGSVVDTPRLCIADNEPVKIHIPEELGIDYFIVHASGHNGAKTEFDYVYGAEGTIYLESKEVISASEGTSDIVVRCRRAEDNKRLTDFTFFNGTLENCKKCWIAIDFYRYHEAQRVKELPAVEHVNPPIDDSAYKVICEDISYATKIATGINALSGICVDSKLGYLYGVSDTFGLYKVDLESKESTLLTYTGKDMEGVCFGSNDDLFACIECEQQVLRFTKDSGYTSYSVVSTVDAQKLEDTMTEWNNGFEGIAYNSETGHFYLGNQFKPISVTEYSLTYGVIGEPFELKFNNEIGGTTEIGDMQYDANGYMWVIDSRSSNIYKYDMEGNNVESFKTNIGSKPNTESLFIDFENDKLYVGCDNADGDIYIFDFEPYKKEENPSEQPSEEPSEEPTLESIVLDKESLELTVGDEAELNVTLTPADIEVELVWSTSDANITTVEDGKVTAVGVGEATITVTAGEKSAECLVKVTAKQEEQGGDEEEEQLKVYYGFIQSSSNKQKASAMLESLTEEQVNTNCLTELEYVLDEPLTPFEVKNETESKQFLVVKLPKSLNMIFTDTDDQVNTQDSKEFDLFNVIVPLSLTANMSLTFADTNSWKSVVISKNN